MAYDNHSYDTGREFAISRWKTSLLLVPMVPIVAAIFAAFFSMILEAPRIIEGKTLAQALQYGSSVIALGVIGSYLAFSALLLFRILNENHPIAVIGPDGIEGLGFFRWKKIEWHDIGKVDYREGYLRVRRIYERPQPFLLRLVAGDTFGDWLFLNFAFMTTSRELVARTFNEYCPEEFRIKT